jgi:hypothetical protein
VKQRCEIFLSCTSTRQKNHVRFTGKCMLYCLCQLPPEFSMLFLFKINNSLYLSFQSFIYVMFRACPKICNLRQESPFAEIDTHMGLSAKTRYIESNTGKSARQGNLPCRRFPCLAFFFTGVWFYFSLLSVVVSSARQKKITCVLPANAWCTVYVNCPPNSPCFSFLK